MKNVAIIFKRLSTRRLFVMSFCTQAATLGRPHSMTIAVDEIVMKSLVCCVTSKVSAQIRAHSFADGVSQDERDAGSLALDRLDGQRVQWKIWNGTRVCACFRTSKTTIQY